MSDRKPPSRPPPPRQPAVRSHSYGNSSSLGKSNFRNPFPAISISYKPTSSRSLDDSDEEIQIVRKRKEADESTTEHNLTTQCADSCQRSEPEELSAITHLTNSGQNTESSDVKQSLSQRRSSSEISLVSPGDNLTAENQKTWPSKNSESYPSIPMKFLKTKSQCDAKSNFSKSEPILSNEENEPVDVGSHSSRSHLYVDSEAKERERSPSPFRRFLKLQNSDSASSMVSNDKQLQHESVISLSSLLASERESGLLNSEIDNGWVHVEEESDEEEGLYFDALSGTSENASIRTQPLQSPDKTPSFTAFLLCVLLFYAYLVSTPNAFISGFVLGSLLVYLIGCAFLWICCPEDSISERYIRELNEYKERLKTAPPRHYKSVDPGFLLTARELQGWMYKAKNYEHDNFDFSEAVPVFTSLNNKTLKLSHPRPDVNGKRIDPRTVDENAFITYTSHEQYCLTGAVVHLVPVNIPVKRIWSRKFPIKVIISSTKQTGMEGFEDSDYDDIGSSVISKLKKLNSVDNDSVTDIFYLFARTGREKEEWYNMLQSVLKQKKDSKSTNPSCSYPHYMASLLPAPGTSETSSQIAWVNVMFGRVFWDVWQDKYWSDKIKLRFQNKLSKLKKPSFIRDIRIADLSLGHSLPIVNQASLPVVDERGTWVDLDVTYCGGLVFSLEGHLNVEGYLAAFISLGQDNEVSSDLDMSELVKKYEIVEEVTNAAQGTDSESDTTSSSDSDFESPESDFEDADNISISNLGSSSSSAYGISECTEEHMTTILATSGMESEGNLTETDSKMVDLSSASKKQTEMNSKHILDRYETNSSGKNSGSNEKSDSSELWHSSAEKEHLESDKCRTSKHNSSDSEKLPKKNRTEKASSHSGAKKKILGVIERLAKSKWVKRAAETEIVKRAAERFSNLPITLSVEVQAVNGTIALNIPPPPTNRLWYGFRGNPMLFVTARPKLGERQVKLTHVTEWIEKKLKQEFKNMFVLPNMEDIPIKLMHSGLEEQFAE